MILLREYKLIKEKIVSIDKYRSKIIGNDNNAYCIYKNITLCFFEYDMNFNQEKINEFFYELRFDKEIKGIYKVSFSEKLKELIDNKILIDEEKEEETKIYKFNVNKIISYNEMFTISNNKTFYNEKRKSYENELNKEFKRNNQDFLLGEILKSEKVEIEIDFIINYTQKDIDNITKPFIDILYKSAELKNDNNIQKIISRKTKNEDSNEEFILIKIRKITKKENISLLEQFNKQECSII